MQYSDEKMTDLVFVMKTQQYGKHSDSVATRLLRGRQDSDSQILSPD